MKFPKRKKFSQKVIIQVEPPTEIREYSFFPIQLEPPHTHTLETNYNFLVIKTLKIKN